MTNSLPTLRPEYLFQIDSDPRSENQFLAVYRNNGFYADNRLISHALPTNPHSYEEALELTAMLIESTFPHLFMDSPATEKARYQEALNTLLKETDQ